jgi:deazaflavin-dependent oxidoreductase (nitroreductase family)
LPGTICRARGGGRSFFRAPPPPGACHGTDPIERHDAPPVPAPVALYRCRLGWLFGHRFLMLVHVGRRTGRTYRTILEVIEYRREIPELIVLSGFGPDAAWLRNIDARGGAEIVVGSQRFAARHRRLAAAEAAAAFAGYERRHRLIAPIVRRVLSRLLGWRYDGSDAARLRLAAQLPFIAFRPR